MSGIPCTWLGRTAGSSTCIAEPWSGRKWHSPVKRILRSNDIVASKDADEGRDLRTGVAKPCPRRRRAQLRPRRIQQRDLRRVQGHGDITRGAVAAVELNH